MASLKKLCSEISTIFLVLSLPVALVLSNYHAGKKTGFCIHHELGFRLARLFSSRCLVQHVNFRVSCNFKRLNSEHILR